MKFAKIPAFILLAAVLICMSGCKPKIWTIDFTAVPDIDDWYQYGLNNLTSYGLWLDNDAEVSAPVAFLGNFTAVLTFDLNTKPGGEGYFELWFGDDWTFNCWSGVYLDYLSTTGDVQYGAYESNGPDSDDLYWNEGALTSLLREGENVLRVVKSMKHFTVYVNGVPAFSYNQGSIYTSNYYCPGLYSEYWDNVNDFIVYKDLTVEYTGTMIDVSI